MLLHWAHAVRDEAKDQLTAFSVAVMSSPDIKDTARTQWLSRLQRVADMGVTCGETIKGLKTDEGRFRFIGAGLSSAIAGQWRDHNESALEWLAMSGKTEAEAISAYQAWDAGIKRMLNESDGVPIEEWAHGTAAFKNWERGQDQVEIDEDGNEVTDNID